MLITQVRRSAEYQHKRQHHYVLSVTLENNPARYELVVYKQHDIVVPIEFSEESSPSKRYWNRSAGKPDSFITTMVDEVILHKAIRLIFLFE